MLHCSTDVLHGDAVKINTLLTQYFLLADVRATSRWEILKHNKNYEFLEPFLRFKYEAAH